VAQFLISTVVHFLVDIRSQPSYSAHIRPVVYFTNPAQITTIGHYKHSLLVFDSLDQVTDEFSSWEPYYHQAVASADLVLAASQQLFVQAKAINPYTLLIPNGCDFAYFAQARKEVTSLTPPPDLPELKRAVIGYIGAVASWCDLALLDQLALAFPDCSLLIVGPLYNVRNIPNRPNIHWLGYKPYEQLLDYARYFDVGLIPFKQSEMTKAVNPIKMWEYMAMGIPVVTTALPEAQAYGDLIYFSANQENFIGNVRRALKNENWQRCENRMALARENSWMTRARQMLLAIEERLKDKGFKSPGKLPKPSNTTSYHHKYYTIKPDQTILKGGLIRHRLSIEINKATGLEHIKTSQGIPTDISSRVVRVFHYKKEQKR
jgi:glycosyltransferase involved in cell wall biosynthesis